MTILQGLDSFIREQHIRNNSKKTIKSYSQFCGYFVDFLGEDYSVNDLIIEDIENYYLFLVSKNTMNDITIQTYIRHIRSFINFLYSKNYIKNNIMYNYKLPRASKKLIEILTDEEIQIIFYVIKKRFSKKYVDRNLLLFALLLDCGLRSSEVVCIQFKNINFDNKIIKVLGKGNKERYVPFGNITYKYLKEYIKKVSFSSDYLFGDEFCYNSLKCFIRKLKNLTLINRLHSHLIRHTFATRFIINGGDSIILQEILGHTTLHMVQVYVHLANQYLIGKFRKFSPLDNLNYSR